MHPRDLKRTGIVIIGFIAAGILAWRSERVITPEALRISKETTRITAPVKDGVVDYLGYFTKACGGTIPDGTNAAVQLAKLLGPNSARIRKRGKRDGKPSPLPEGWEKRLSPAADAPRLTPPPLPDKDRQVTLAEFIGDPKLNSWVNENGPVYNRLVEILEYRDFALLVGEVGERSTVYIQPILGADHLAILLVGHGMTSYRQGDFNGLIEDLNRAMTLAARLRVGAPKNYAEAMRIETQVYSIVGTIAANDRAGTVLCSGLTRLLNNSPKPAYPFDAVETVRFQLLDSIAKASRQRTSTPAFGIGMGIIERVKVQFPPDPNHVTARVNANTDALLKSMSAPTIDERIAATSTLQEGGIDTLDASAFDTMFGNAADKQAFSEAAYVAFANERIGIAARQAAFIHADTVIRYRLAQAALALRRYKLLQGNYPESLAALTEKAKDALTNPFTGKRMTMEFDDDGLPLLTCRSNELKDRDGKALDLTLQFH